MPDPLPISREIAAEVLDSYTVGTPRYSRDDDGEFVSANASEVAAIIDARIRPLVEALRICRFFLSCTGDSKEEQSLFQQAVEIADAALKAGDSANSP